MTHPRRLAPAALLAVLAVACTGDDPDAAVDVTAACDRLETLASAILESSDATTTAQFVAGVSEPLDAFVAAAGSSGDDKLAELAEIYSREFATWSTSSGIDAREARGNADVALDRAGARCLELGATNDFPQQP
ncbi:MAG TPA: hypothetical protein VH479_07425 [Acidimicrobiales bacterium]|jgi:hypothetical protein